MADAYSNCVTGVWDFFPHCHGDLLGKKVLSHPGQLHFWTYSCCLNRWVLWGLKRKGCLNRIKMEFLVRKWSLGNICLPSTRTSMRFGADVSETLLLLHGLFLCLCGPVVWFFQVWWTCFREVMRLHCHGGRWGLLPSAECGCNCDFLVFGSLYCLYPYIFFTRWSLRWKDTHTSSFSKYLVYTSILSSFQSESLLWELAPGSCCWVPCRMSILDHGWSPRGILPQGLLEKIGEPFPWSSSHLFLGAWPVWHLPVSVSQGLEVEFWYLWCFEHGT